MTKEKINPLQLLDNLKIIHVALIIGQLIFAGITVYLINAVNPVALNGLSEIFLLVGLAFTVGGIFGSRKIFKSSLDKIQKEMPLEDKLTSYRTSLMIKYAILEAPSFFAIVSLLITANHLFLLFTGLIIAVFVTSAPGMQKLIADLNLSDDEKESLTGTMHN